jgi:hypothetical protein
LRLHFPRYMRRLDGRWTTKGGAPHQEPNRSALQSKARAKTLMTSALARLVAVTAHELPVPPLGDEQYRTIANAAYAAFRRAAITKRQARLLGVLGPVLMHKHSIQQRAVRRFSAQEAAHT